MGAGWPGPRRNQCPTAEPVLAPPPLQLGGKTRGSRTFHPGSQELPACWGRGTEPARLQERDLNPVAISETRYVLPPFSARLLLASLSCPGLAHAWCSPPNTPGLGLSAPPGCDAPPPASRSPARPPVLIPSVPPPPSSLPFQQPEERGPEGRARRLESSQVPLWKARALRTISMSGGWVVHLDFNKAMLPVMPIPTSLQSRRPLRSVAASSSFAST